VSPDGDKLAYAALRVGALPITIRDLATGAARSINLERLIGPGDNLLNASMAWLADGTDMAVIPTHNASPGFSPTNPGSRNASSCPTGFSSTCLIIIHVEPAGHRLSARRLTIPIPAKYDAKDVLAADASAPRSFLLAADGWQSQLGLGTMVVDRLTLRSSDVTTQRLFSIPAAAAMTFNPTGTRLLYVHGRTTKTQWLWEARLAQSQPINPHILLRQPQIGASAAW
jgi:hypothetical protein